MLDRRTLLAGALAWPLVSRADAPRAVLFVGNSFTRWHDVAGRVAAVAAAEGAALDVTVVAVDGTTLAAKWADPALRARMAARDWDAVVLQDYSTAALVPTMAARSAETVVSMARALAPARVVLFETWARAAGHALYARPAMPRAPAAMQAAVAAHYDALARTTAATVAPVGQRLTAAASRGEAVHGRDGHHASAEGAQLAARVLWRTLAGVLDGRVATR